eukprot:TRINITY_DN56299_c0_g1_i1.p1 TRINITY_DN56299_c0_g1~~TRINITY_DN56299_c0_g1_i1.p1  ORF type:complete len:274 (+),score=23.95 TRINITY_DN56299_c0_g1_i1:22-822(+)
MFRSHGLVRSSHLRWITSSCGGVAARPFALAAHLQGTHALPPKSQVLALQSCACSLRKYGDTARPGGSTGDPKPGPSKKEAKQDEEGWLDRIKASGGQTCPPRPASKDILASGAISFGGMGALSLLHFGVTGGSDMTMILGSMGASAVLVYAAPAVPFAQPRNVVGGHLLSAFVGVTTYSLIGSQMWLAVPVATSAAIMGMLATRTVHPPAGGTVLIALMGSSKIQAMGYMLLCPVATTSSLVVIMGIVLNNLLKSTAGRYPTYWW